MTRRGTIYCSFCGRPESEALMLVSGPNWSFICDHCIADAVRVVTQKHPTFRNTVMTELDEAAKEWLAKECREAITQIEGETP